MSYIQCKKCGRNLGEFFPTGRCERIIDKTEDQQNKGKEVFRHKDCGGEVRLVVTGNGGNNVEHRSYNNGTNWVCHI
jgi:hypothetical protein